MSVDTETPFVPGARVRVSADYLGSLVGATGAVLANIGPDEVQPDNPLYAGATGDRLWVKIEGGETEALLASEVELLEEAA